MDPSKSDVAGCLQFDYEELRVATNNFDRRPLNQGGCKLGEGGFGPVYRGRLKFTEVAIKILRNTPKVRVTPYQSYLEGVGAVLATAPA